MTNQSKLEQLIKAANGGDKKAQEKLFEKLAVRFSTLITLEIRKYPVLVKELNPEKKGDEVSQLAIKEVKTICSFGNPEFSLIQAMNILRNILDTTITNLLAGLAKEGNKEAENILFAIIRKKLMERIILKRGNDAN